MKNFLLTASAVLFAGPHIAMAQNQEIGLTLGRIHGPSRSSTNGSIDLGSGLALQANYGYRFFLSRNVALSGEVHFLANGLRDVHSAVPSATRDVATIYVTPGLRLKFAPGTRFSPYVVGGGGYALYEQSFYRQDRLSNQAPRFTNRGVLAFGGGADIPVWKWIGARFEARDFYSGNPSFNTPVIGSGQHNVVASGGFVLSFGGRREG
jgi:opacity protein-like surface antigen